MRARWLPPEAGRYADSGDRLQGTRIILSDVCKGRGGHSGSGVKI